MLNYIYALNEGQMEDKLVVKRHNFTLNELFVEHILDISIKTRQSDIFRAIYSNYMRLKSK